MYQEIKADVEKALKGKNPDQIKKMIADALVAAFFAAKGLAATGDPFSGNLQEQIIAAAEQFPHGKEASNTMRAALLGPGPVYHGTSAPVKRAPAPPYIVGAKPVQSAPTEEPPKEVGRFSAPKYQSPEVSDPDKPCDGCGEEVPAPDPEPDVEREIKEELVLPDVIISDEEGNPKLLKSDLFETTDEVLAASLSQNDLLEVLQRIGGDPSGSRSKAAIAKRIIRRVEEIKGK